MSLPKLYQSSFRKFHLPPLVKWSVHFLQFKSHEIHSIFCKSKLFSLSYYLRKLEEASNIGTVTSGISSQSGILHILLGQPIGNSALFQTSARARATHTHTHTQAHTHLEDWAHCCSATVKRRKYLSKHNILCLVYYTQWKYCLNIPSSKILLFALNTRPMLIINLLMVYFAKTW